MRANLGPDDLGTPLDEPPVAVLATLRRDGTVLLSPVCHEWRDGGFNVWSGAEDIEAKHLRRDPRATIVVAENGGQLRGIEVRGTAELIDEGARETGHRIFTRHLGDDAGPATVDVAPGPAVIIRLAPGSLRWDFADET